MTMRPQFYEHILLCITWQLFNDYLQWPKCGNWWEQDGAFNFSCWGFLNNWLTHFYHKNHFGHLFEMVWWGLRSQIDLQFYDCQSYWLDGCFFMQLMARDLIWMLHYILKTDLTHLLFISILVHTDFILILFDTHLERIIQVYHYLNQYSFI